VRDFRADQVKGVDEPAYEVTPAFYTLEHVAVIPADAAVKNVTLDKNGRALVHLTNGVTLRQEQMGGLWRIRR
jgi:hypothetical protein